MAGVKGRSGRRPKPLEAHILAGTFRPDRHGPQPAVGANALKPQTSTAPPSELVQGLGEAGAQLVRETFAAYEGWTPPQLLLLRKAAELTDATVSGPNDADPRLWLARHRALLATLRELGIKEGPC